MKRLILLLSIIALVFTSCGSDDDGGSSQDPIIGTWKYHKYFENGVEQTVTVCEKQETFVFNSNGTFEYAYYEEDIDDNCVLEESFSGTWSNDGNGMYTQYIGGDAYSRQITFENNTFYYEDVYDFGTPNDTSDDITDKEVYIKQ